MIFTVYTAQINKSDITIFDYKGGILMTFSLLISSRSHGNQNIINA